MALYGEIEAIRVQIASERIKGLEFMQQKYRSLESNHTVTAFVTFHHSFAKINLLRLNHFSFLNRMGHPLKLSIKGLEIRRAPEPEDVIW